VKLALSGDTVSDTFVMFTVTPTFKGLLEAPGTTMETWPVQGLCAAVKPEPPIRRSRYYQPRWCLSSRYRN